MGECTTRPAMVLLPALVKMKPIFVGAVSRVKITGIHSSLPAPRLFLPSPACSPPPALARSASGRIPSRRWGMAGARRRRVSRSPSPTGLRPPTPSSSFEISSPAPTEDQTDPFECCSVTPCVCCVFYKSRCRATTGAGGSLRPVSRGAGPSPAPSGSASRDSTARRAASGSVGGSENADNGSAFD